MEYVHMNNFSSINSGTFSDPHQGSSGPRQPTSINGPHAFSSVSNSSIPLSGASRTSINSSHLPCTPHADDAQTHPLATRNDQPVRAFFQLYKAAPSMNLPSDSRPAATQPDHRAPAKGPTALKQPRLALSSPQAEKR